MMRCIMGLGLDAPGEAEGPCDEGMNSIFPPVLKIDAWKIQASPIPLDDREMIERQMIDRQIEIEMADKQVVIDEDKQIVRDDR